LNYWILTIKLVFRQDLQSNNLGYASTIQKNLALSFARHYCSRKNKFA